MTSTYRTSRIAVFDVLGFCCWTEYNTGLPSEYAIPVVYKNSSLLFLLFVVLFCWAKEKPSFCIFRHQPEISIETDLVSISKWFHFRVLTKFKISSEQTNCFNITFKIIQNNIFNRRCAWFMEELIVVVEKRKTGNFRMRQIFHRYNLIEFRFVLFEDVDVLG